MAIEMECGICGQEHRFRDTDSGRATRCKECSARIDIPRGGIGGILDGTTPILTPPVILCGVVLIVAVGGIAIWEVMDGFRSPVRGVATQPPVAQPGFAQTPNFAPARTQGSGRSATSTPVPAVPQFPGFPTPGGARPPDSSIQNRPAPTTTFPVPRSATNAGVTVTPNEEQRKRSARQLEFIRESYDQRKMPLVRFNTQADCPLQIHEISPSWAEPGEDVRLTGVGFQDVTHVVAIDSLTFTEHPLVVRGKTDTELIVTAPPMIGQRDHAVFVFELHTARGVGVTFPRELVDVGPYIVSGEVALLNREQTAIVASTFGLLDGQGSVGSVNTARLYALNLEKVLDLRGVDTKVFVTPDVKLGTVSGPKLETVSTPAIWPSFLDRLFVGPNCNCQRLRLQREIEQP